MKLHSYCRLQVASRNAPVCIYLFYLTVSVIERSIAFDWQTFIVALLCSTEYGNRTNGV